MLRNYLKTTVRSMRRHPGFSAINLLGLTVGFTAAFFIMLWVQDEQSFDQFHTDADRIYQVYRHWHQSDGFVSTNDSMPMPLAEVLESNYPEIQNVVLFSYEQDHALTYGDQVYREEGRFAGQDFFKVFDWNLLLGNEESVLEFPNSIGLSESLAGKLFGEDWEEKSLLGTTITMDNEVELVVGGVFADIPVNSSFSFEYVVNVEEFIRTNSWVHQWGNTGLRIFIRVEENAHGAALSDKIRTVIADNHESSSSELFLKPYSDLHLYSTYEDGVQTGGRIEYVNIFTIVGLFLLIIASINFMNLATARSALRALEIGVRKALGSNRSAVAKQFLVESVLMAIFAFAISVMLVVLLLPLFNSITEKEVRIANQTSLVWLSFGGIALLTGLLAGSYPALYLSSFNIIGVLRGEHSNGVAGTRLRKGLVVFQFALSIILIASTVTVYRQIEYIRTKDLGMDKSNLVQMTYEGGVKDQYESFRADLLSRPGIETVSTSSQVAFSIGTSSGGPTWDGKHPDDNTSFNIMNGQMDLAQMLGLELAAGRYFSEDFGADSLNFLINETAANAMGFEDPVGQRLAMWGREGQIIGVIKDFHGQSLYQDIKPTIIRFDPESTFLLFVRLDPDQTAAGLASLESVFTVYNPEFPFDYTFADDDYQAQYRGEFTIGTLANVFAGLALFIACLGLFGLASFTAERRRKEIGIRKVLGATMANIVGMLSREFLLLVGLALLIAIPIAQKLSVDWLKQFAFHVESGYGIFLFAGGAVLIITAITVGYQSIRAALLNPADSLKDE